MMRRIHIWNYQRIGEFVPEVRTLAIRIGSHYGGGEFEEEIINPLIVERRIIAGEIGLRGNEVKDGKYDEQYSGPIFDETHAERVLDLICEFSDCPDILFQCHGGMSRAPSLALVTWEIFGGELYHFGRRWEQEGNLGVRDFVNSALLNKQYYDTMMKVARRRGLLIK